MLPVSQLKMLAYVSLFLVVLSTAKFCHGDELDGSSDGRHKRGPTVGLFAFPRVGRSDPELVEWGDAALPVELADDYRDYPIREYKRQGLVPFPRVGRSGPSLAARYWPVSMQQKRAGNSGSSSGMWFGPRLGKRANAAASEIKGNEVYTPRLGRNLPEASYFSRPMDYRRQFQLSLPSEN
ncbi:cardio acceleratory peptide 2b isoform X2 [Wyeomyia smithii]|uniref:cardio acceleratory peptide 2b isoform X2 n=1 Tax=Wyeomyia smithii TaxID=174621 RepID=UPI0024680ABC|nr:cardio acceleratory peptide 2b isoform X2 [Wyeomyia smithii]